MHVRSLVVEPAPYACSMNEVLAEATLWLGDNSPALELFQRFQRSSQVSSKRLIRPPAQIRALNGSKERSEIFRKEGLPLLERVGRLAIEQSGISPLDISSVIFTSCSSPTIPSLDASVAPRLGLKKTIRRYPFYQHGCAGGVAALGLSPTLSAGDESVLLLSLELCSLAFFNEDIAAAGLVGAAIFADGAAAAVISGSGNGVRVTGSYSVLIPETEYLMGYDIHDNGSHLRLDRELPSVVLSEAATSLPIFLKEHGTSTREIDYWLIHPGGARILERLEEVLSLSRGQCRWSWDVLRNVGNMSSASIYFVMRSFLDSEEGQNFQKFGGSAVVVGIGPGLTLQYVLLESEK